MHGPSVSSTCFVTRSAQAYLYFRVAGSDTSSTTITYILWELSKRPDILKRLQAELDEIMPDSRAIPDIAILQELPYLSGVVKEGAI